MQFQAKMLKHEIQDIS